MQWRRARRFDAYVALDQEDTEETIGNGLNCETDKSDPLPRFGQTCSCLKTAATSLWDDWFGKNLHPAVKDDTDL